MSHYEAVIGVEIHVQLLTQSKIFCSCATRFGALPNSQVCPVCSGLPGSLPVLNQTALDYIIKAALSLNCLINTNTGFARKNYFYPDLPKGYQISQFENPVAENGSLKIYSEHYPAREILIRRIHLEEDAGKSIHPENDNLINQSCIDFNRCGVPLIEIVTEPDLHSPEETYLFLTTLKQLILYLGISDCNMEEGSLRCDANISLRPIGVQKLGVKTELKNMNSFRGVERALNFEIQRQTSMIDSGQSITQETMLWDDNRQEVRAMRSKEDAHDYRYFPEPDLIPFHLSRERIEAIRGIIPELPRPKYLRYLSDFHLPDYNAQFLTATPQYAAYFEEAIHFYFNPTSISNWMMGDLTKAAKERKCDLSELKIQPEMMSRLVRLIDEGKINSTIAKQVFEAMLESGEDPEKIINCRGMNQVTDSQFIEEVIDHFIRSHPDERQQYRSGKDKVFGYFVGEIMKATKGKANPKIVNELLQKKL